MGSKKKQAVEYVGLAWPGLEGGFIAILDYIFDQ